MNDGLIVLGILLGAAGAIALAWTQLYPESARRESRRVRNLTHRAQNAGLRGRYILDHGPSRSGSTGGHEAYEPADNEDRALFAVIGSRMEGEATFFANEMLWTDYRLAWVGVPLLVIGVVISVTSVFV